MSRILLYCFAIFSPLLAAASAPAQEITLPLTARGNEPFWSVEATSEGLRLSEPEGKGTVQSLPFVQGKDGESLILSTTDFTLRIDPILCRDDMSGMPFPFTATLTRAGADQSGCAGDSATLLTADWTVTTLNGSALPEGVGVTLSFMDGRVSGSSGCNRFMGGYAVTGEGLRLDGIATTRMACPAPKMEAEQAVLAALASVTRFDIDDEGALLLQSEAATTVLSARR